MCYTSFTAVTALGKVSDLYARGEARTTNNGREWGLHRGPTLRMQDSRADLLKIFLTVWFKAPGTCIMSILNNVRVVNVRGELRTVVWSRLTFWEFIGCVVWL